MLTDTIANIGFAIMAIIGVLGFLNLWRVITHALGAIFARDPEYSIQLWQSSHSAMIGLVIVIAVECAIFFGLMFIIH